jgi:hypothetical protein
MRTRSRTFAAACLAAGALILCFAASALAAPAVTVFSAESPAKGALITTVPPGTITVAASCTAPMLADGRTFTVDGKAVTSYFANPPGGVGHWVLQEYWNDDDEMWESDWVWVMSPDTLHATLTAYSTALGADGTHTVVVGVKNNTGTLATDSWTITTKIPPTLGTPAPAAGSVVATTMPVIAVSASDNTTVSSASATIN